jgi:hypothetical protein
MDEIKNCGQQQHYRSTQLKLKIESTFRVSVRYRLYYNVVALRLVYGINGYQSLCERVLAGFETHP